MAELQRKSSFDREERCLKIETRSILLSSSIFCAKMLGFSDDLEDLLLKSLSLNGLVDGQILSEKYISFNTKAQVLQCLEIKQLAIGNHQIYFQPDDACAATLWPFPNPKNAAEEALDLLLCTPISSDLIDGQFWVRFTSPQDALSVIKTGAFAVAKHSVTFVNPWNSKLSLPTPLDSSPTLPRSLSKNSTSSVELWPQRKKLVTSEELLEVARKNSHWLDGPPHSKLDPPNPLHKVPEPALLSKKNTTISPERKSLKSIHDFQRKAENFKLAEKERRSEDFRRLSIGCEFVAQNRHALVVSMTNYDENVHHSFGTLSPVLNAAEDAKIIHDFLSEVCNFKSITMISEEMSFDMIIKTNEKFSCHGKDPDIRNLLFIYYTGHALVTCGQTFGLVTNGKLFPLDGLVKTLAHRSNNYVISVFDCSRTMTELKIVDEIEQHYAGHVVSIYSDSSDHCMTDSLVKYLTKTPKPFPNVLKSWQLFAFKHVQAVVKTLCDVKLCYPM